MPVTPLARSRRRAWTCAALLAAVWLGCAAPPRDDELARSPGAEHRAESLEEIFSLPPAYGAAPRALALSADGLWLLADWSELAYEPDGSRRLIKDGSLRLLSVREPRGACGTSVASLLPARDPDRPAGRWTWAFGERDSLLAVARDHEVFLLEPDDRGAWHARAAFASGVDSETNGAKTADVADLAFERDDQELWIDDGRELYALELAALGAQPATPGAPGVRCVSEGFAARTAGLRWSRDRKVALDREGRFGASSETTEGEADPIPESEDDGDEALNAESESAARAPGAQIFWIDERREVELEGFAAMDLPSCELSPDGRFVFAAHAPDRDDAPAATLVPDYLTDRVSTRSARAELAEDLLPARELWMWDAATGARSAIDLGGEPTRSLWTIGWSPAEHGDARFAFARISQDWRTYELFVWTPHGLELAFRDHDDRWYGGPSVGARWSGDGSVLIVGSEATTRSTTPGRCQLFALDPASKQIRQLTNVRGEVDSFATRADGSLIYCASDGDPTRRVLGFVNAAMVRGERAGESRELDLLEGFKSDVVAASRGSTVVYAHHELGRPAELRAFALDGSLKPRGLTDAAPGRFVERERIGPRAFVARGADGVDVWSHVFLPRSTSLSTPDRARPCVVFIHGAGYLQNVTRSLTEYAPNLLFHARLAELGYVVVDVDYRGSAGYGRSFRTDVQYRLGELELADIRATLDALGRRGVIDRERVGCYGGSYGGFLTLMALFLEPDRWRCGAALRSVTDWRTYHPSYTQPRLGRPSTHAQAYERSSPIDHAQHLRAPLLLLHGMVDSNVFAQDTIRLIEKLIDLGKDFDAMLYPSQGHAFSEGPHWIDQYRRIERLMRTHLGEP